MELFNKKYDWEGLYDLGRDVLEAVEGSGVPDEYEGVIQVVMTFIPKTVD